MFQIALKLTNQITNILNEKKLFITFCIIRIIIDVIINCFYNFFDNNIRHTQLTKNERIIDNNVTDCVKTKNKIMFSFRKKKFALFSMFNIFKIRFHFEFA